jgi:Carbohydrate family 9 binding domain-like
VSRVAASLAGALLTTASCVADPPEAQLDAATERRFEASLVSAQPPGLTPSGVVLSGLTLVGHRTTSVGGKVSLTLVWRVDGRPPVGSRLFTRIVDSNGVVLSVHDSQGALRATPGVAGCPLPPSNWPAGRFVIDRVDLGRSPPLPRSARVVVGLMDARGRPLPGPGGETAAWLDWPGAGSRTTSPPPPTPVPELAVARWDGGAIAIDGVLDEPGWTRAARTGPFVHAGNGSAAGSLPIGGRARLAYDDRFLYLAVEARDRDVVGGFPESAIDPHLWTRDCVELMIDPEGDGDNRDYYEIQVNPQGLVFDSRFDDYNVPRRAPDGPFGHQDWSSALERGVVVDGTLDHDGDEDGGYIVEARLPWAALGRAIPKPGESWRINLYVMQNNGGVAWSPILGRGNFHRASRFGRVTFAP